MPHALHQLLLSLPCLPEIPKTNHTGFVTIQIYIERLLIRNITVWMLMNNMDLLVGKLNL